MALYLISYDIDEKDEFEYEFLWKRLKEIGAVRILKSEWALIEKVAKAVVRRSITIGETHSVDRSFRLDYDGFDGMRQNTTNY